MLPLASSTLNTILTNSSFPSAEIKNLIKAEAKRLGFAFCGVASPETGEAFKRYQAWLDEGLYAKMAYLARPDAIAKRQNVEALLPGCKSVLCLALPYAQPQKTSGDNGVLAGWVAAYACYADYHDLMREKLVILGDRIEALFGRPVRRYVAVDSGPVLEKSFALQAGLGLIGKNTLLWNPSLGTWFFLGELLLDIALEADKAMEGNFCGDCDICVRACPTGALRGDKRMDAARCLSYLTIEHRDAIPVEYRRAMGMQIFGCDICQVACPKNIADIPRGMSYAMEPVMDGTLDLLEALSLTQAAFKTRYAGKPLSRARYQGFRRNVIIALGNSGHPEALNALKACLKTENDDVCRESMVWAINQLKESFTQNLKHKPG